MRFNKITWILIAVILFGAGLFGTLAYILNRSKSVDFYYLTSKEPVSHDNIIMFSAKVNNISSSVNKFVEGENWKIPPIKVYNSKLSYRDARRSWLIVNDDFVIFILYDDVSSILTTEEVVAAIFHEIGHVKLGHFNNVGPDKKRDTQEEINADQFAVKAGIDPRYLSSAIAKLSMENEERRLRLEALDIMDIQFKRT